MRNKRAWELGAGVLLVLALALVAFVSYGRFRQSQAWERLQVPLFSAVQRGDVEEVKTIIRRSGLRGRLGDHTPVVLHEAVHLNRLEIARVLLEAGANPNVRVQDSPPPLLAAVMSGSPDYRMIQLLLDAGADPNAREPAPIQMSSGSLEFQPRDQTVLMRAVISGQDRIARLLMERGASVDEVDSEGKTVLHWWVLMRAHDPASVQLGRELVKRTKSTNVRDQSGKTALDYARGRADDPRIPLLERAAAAR